MASFQEDAKSNDELRDIRELKQLRRRRQRERQKAIGLD